MVVAHCHSGPARLKSFEDLTISDVSLFGWDELPTELERPKWYVPDDLSQVLRERIQAQLRQVSSRMGLTARTSDEIGNCARNRELQECEPARRMRLAIMEN